MRTGQARVTRQTQPPSPRSLRLVLIAALEVAGLLLSLSLAEEKPVVTAIGYSDLVRFQAQAPGVVTLRVEVFDLRGQRLFDSGPAAGQALDWWMMNERGERVAYGVYLYVATAWDAQGKALEQRLVKLAITPGGTSLGLAPARAPGERPLASEEDKSARALDQTIADNLIVQGWIKAVGSGSASKTVEGGPSENRGEFALIGHHPGNNGDMALFSMRSDMGNAVFSVKDQSAGIWHEAQ